MSEWRPISTFDYNTERKRFGSVFVGLIASDGERVSYVDHWGDENGFMRAVGAEEPLGWKPTHWMQLPDPPTSPTPLPALDTKP